MNGSLLGWIKKWKKMDTFEYQDFRNVIKKGGEGMIENFEKKYKELKIEGNSKRVAETIYIEKETLTMGSESEDRKMY